MTRSKEEGASGVSVNFVPIYGALVVFLIALQWKRENLLGKKQLKFAETNTPLEQNICIGSHYKG